MHNKSKTLYIKNMVCNRCIKVIEDEFSKLGIRITRISLGEVELDEEPDNNTLSKIKFVLETNGFELLEDRRAKVIEKIKTTVIKNIYESKLTNKSKENFSTVIEKELGMEYHYLSSLFSSMESITIEQFIILQKIERAKELLKYGEMTLSEISYELGYSSVQHLSNQFKKITGLSASQFKSFTKNFRKPLDSVSK